MCYAYAELQGATTPSGFYFFCREDVLWYAIADWTPCIHLTTDAPEGHSRPIHRKRMGCLFVKSEACESMDKDVALDEPTDPLGGDAVEALRRRLGRLDQRQIAAWREMSPARRLELAFQAYQFALDAVRLTERRNHPSLSPEELAWRVTRRMQGNLRLGR